MRRKWNKCVHGFIRAMASYERHIYIYTYVYIYIHIRTYDYNRYHKSESEIGNCYIIIVSYYQICWDNPPDWPDQTPIILWWPLRVWSRSVGLQLRPAEPRLEPQRYIRSPTLETWKIEGKLSSNYHPGSGKFRTDQKREFLIGLSYSLQRSDIQKTGDLTWFNQQNAVVGCMFPWDVNRGAAH